MITIKTASEIDKMRLAGALLYKVLQELRSMAVPGITTKELDEHAEKMIRANGAIPSFKGYNGFPASICASVDEQVVHGFPNTEKLRQGQLLSIDCGVILDGWQSDSALSLLVGGGSEQAQKLIDVTEQCFWRGADKARAGNRLGDVSNAIQKLAESHGYGVIRDLCGHGIGREMHEDPNVPNFGPAGRGVKLEAGMTLAIEPMISMRGWKVNVLSDGWTVVTRDRSLCSHYEHTVLVTDGRPEILSYPGGEAKL